MKAKNLQILKDHHINVPPFIVVEDINNIDISFSRASLFAVRSSFYLEDDVSHSFAGQFQTLLNVERKNIKKAVIEVQESYKKPLYKNIGNQDISSPVIIQEMIQPDYSGIMFTANPLGILNEIVITVGQGLGENVVTDKTETITYYYNKDEMLFYLKEEAPISLPHSLLKELVDLANQIQTIFHQEMDIEFAIQNDIIYILQARPITTLSIENITILDNSNIVESYPGVSLPITQDFVHDIYRDIFKSCILRISKDKDLVLKMNSIFDNMVTSYNWAMYYQISNWYEILQLLPFSKKIIQIWQEMLGVHNKVVNKGSLHIRKALKIKMIFSFFYHLLRSPKEMKQLNQYFNDIYPQYQQQIQTTNSVTELLELLEHFKKSITDIWDITLINDMYAFLFTALSGGNKNERIANIKNMESMKPVLAMNKLSLLYKKYGFESEQYIQKEKEYIALYGDRILGELKLETKTYRTNPELLREHILSLDTLFTHQEDNKKSFHPFVKRAKIGIANREKSRLNRSRLFGLAREIVLKIGHLLKENHQINSIDDIFYLYFNEINTTTSYQNLIDKRKEEYNINYHSPHPRRIVFSQGIIETKRTSLNDQFSDIQTLQGIQTSLGIVKGEAIVIEDANNTIDVHDKIIITKSTDPGWVFLLEKCKGIIAEQGSILSHTAIISRELHKPAIVNVKDATKIIKTGDFLELDANNGNIKIIKNKK